MKKTMVVGGICFILLTFLLASTAVLSENKAEMKKEKTVVQFKLKDIDGKIVDSKDLLKNNDILLIQFLTPSCIACKSETEVVKELHKKYNKKGLGCVAILNTFGSKDQQKENPIFSAPFPLLEDEKITVARGIEFYAFPALAIVDKKGVVIYDHLGYRKTSKTQIEAAVESALKAAKAMQEMK